MVPCTHPTQHPRLHLDWYSHFCTAHGRPPFPSSKLSLCVGDLESGPIQYIVPWANPSPPMASRSNQPLLQGSWSWQRDWQTDWQADWQTDWQADHATPSITICHNYIVLRFVMLPKKWTPRPSMITVTFGIPKTWQAYHTCVPNFSQLGRGRVWDPLYSPKSFTFEDSGLAGMTKCTNPGEIWCQRAHHRFILTSHTYCFVWQYSSLWCFCERTLNFIQFCFEFKQCCS